MNARTLLKELQYNKFKKGIRPVRAYKSEVHRLSLQLCKSIKQLLKFLRPFKQLEEQITMANMNMGGNRAAWGTRSSRALDTSWEGR